MYYEPKRHFFVFDEERGEIKKSSEGRKTMFSYSPIVGRRKMVFSNPLPCDRDSSGSPEIVLANEACRKRATIEAPFPALAEWLNN